MSQWGWFRVQPHRKLFHCITHIISNTYASIILRGQETCSALHVVTYIKTSYVLASSKTHGVITWQSTHAVGKLASSQIFTKTHAHDGTLDMTLCNECKLKCTGLAKSNIRRVMDDLQHSIIISRLVHHRLVAPRSLKKVKLVWKHSNCVDPSIRSI